MSKKVVSVLAIAVGVALFFIPGGQVLFSIGATTLKLGTVLTAVGTSLVVSGASTLLLKKPKFPSGFGQLYPTQGGVQPRALLLGKFATPGNKVFELSSTNDEVLWQVFVLGIGPITSIDKAVTIEGEQLIIQNDGVGGVVGKYNGHVRIYTRLGYDDQEVVTRLNDEVITQWTEAHKLNGLAYVAVRQQLDPEVLSSPLSLRFHGQGVHLYDPRKDSSVGGVGPHRMGDASTWEYSDNPVLAALTYCIGWRQGATQSVVAGMGLLQSRLTAYLGEIMASASEADETVPLAVSGLEKRYRACGVLQADATHLNNLNHLEHAMAGHVAILARGVRILCGAWMNPVATLGVDDVLGVGNIDTVKSRSGLVNTVTGRFANEANDGKLEEYPPVVDLPARVLDGQTFSEELSLALTPSHTMAQRLARVALKASRTGGIGGREPRSLQISTRLSGMQVEPGDIVRLDLPYLFDGPATFRVRDRVITVGEKSLTVDLDLFEETEAVWAWSVADEAPHFETPFLGSDSSLPAVVGLALAPEPETSVSEVPSPGIRVTWQPEAHSGLAPSELRYRIVANPENAWTVAAPSADSGSYHIFPVTPGEVYEVQLRHVNRYGDAGPWSPPVSMTALGADIDIPWDKVSGDGKPDDGATDGAIPGTNIFDPDTLEVLPREAILTDDAALSLLPLWDFDETDTTQWTGDQMTIVPVDGAYQITSTGNDAKLISPRGLQINGARKTYVAVKLKRVGAPVGASQETARLFFKTSAHGFSGDHVASLRVHFPTNSERVLVFDMRGVGDWSTSVIDQLRLDPTPNSGDVFEIDYIGIGRRAAVNEPPETVNRVGTNAALFEIALQDIEGDTLIVAQTLEAMGLKEGDQISCGLEVLSPSARRGLLRTIFKDVGGVAIDTQRSNSSTANVATYQRVQQTGLIIPPATHSISWALQRENTPSGAVGARGLTVNLGATTAFWRDESTPWSSVTDDGSRPEDGANRTTHTGQLVDDALLGETSKWSSVLNDDGNRPANGATVGAQWGQTFWASPQTSIC